MRSFKIRTNYPETISLTPKQEKKLEEFDFITVISMTTGKVIKEMNAEDLGEGKHVKIKKRDGSVVDSPYTVYNI